MLCAGCLTNSSVRLTSFSDGRVLIYHSSPLQRLPLESARRGQHYNIRRYLFSHLHACFYLFLIVVTLLFDLFLQGFGLPQVVVAHQSSLSSSELHLCNGTNVFEWFLTGRRCAKLLS